MLQLVQIIGLPFLVCIIMGSILGYLGTHVLKREVIFVDIALAQIAAVGSTVAHFAFHVHKDSLISYAFSIGFIVLISAFYAVARRKIVRISLEAVIGISYAIGAAAILFLAGIATGGHMHIQQILSGSLLWVDFKDVILCLSVFAVIGVCFFLIRKPLNYISNDYQQALHKGIKVIFWDFIFYLLLGVVIVLSVQIGGIVVVFAYLIIPATVSYIFSSRLVIQLIIIWTAAIAASVAGLLFAYYFDFSIGPSISLFLGGELIISAFVPTAGRLRLQLFPD